MGGYAYLKWCHPWKILLQEEPDKWEPETDDEAETEQEIQEDTAGSAEEQEYSPLLGRPSEHKVELELHSCASSDQVDQMGEVTKEEEKDSEDSGEEETKV